MTTSTTHNPNLEPAIQTLLATLRRRIRQYVWMDGLALAFVWLGAAFWADLLVDWFFEPSREARVVLLGVVVIGFIVVLIRMIGCRAFTPLPDKSMAMLLERRFTQFDEGLLTAVELSERDKNAQEFNRHLLEHTHHQASGHVSEVRLNEILNPTPLRRNIGALIFFTVSIIMFTVLCPTATSFWAKRCLLFSNELWPRRSHLIVEGFENGSAKVARGSDMEIVVKADTRMPIVPQVVQVRYRTAEGVHGRSAMSRDGVADPTKDPYQEYSYTFRDVLTPIEFDIRGGDAAIYGLKIEVVDSPTIEMELNCVFPAYMNRTPRRLPVTGVMQIPQGATVTVLAKANKDLARVQVDSGQQGPPHTFDIPSKNTDRRGFAYMIKDIAEDTTLLFTLFDTDRIKSRRPTRLAIAVQPDGPPDVLVRLHGIGSAITPQAQLPTIGRITDDYGIANVWFKYTIDKTKPKIQPIFTSGTDPTELQMDAALDVRDLAIKPGQKLQVCIQASDRYDLGDTKNVGTSERQLLAIVTPDKLRTMLQARELVLRQRFDMIIREVAETADVLTRINFDQRPAKDADTGAEPGDVADKTPQPTDAESAKRLLATQKLRVQRALQNSSKNAHEILGVAEGFDNIRLQLVNNRIDTEELKLRLKKGIAQPLKQIAESMFPKLEKKLQTLDATLAEPSGPKNQQAAVTQINEILTQMRQVLDRMIELEDFNEAIELLRSIIESQEKLHGQTKERHKKKLRELLEN